MEETRAINKKTITRASKSKIISAPQYSYWGFAFYEKIFFLKPIDSLRLTLYNINRKDKQMTQGEQND